MLTKNSKKENMSRKAKEKPKWWVLKWMKIKIKNIFMMVSLVILPMKNYFLYIISTFYINIYLFKWFIQFFNNLY